MADICTGSGKSYFVKETTVIRTKMFFELLDFFY